MATKREQKTEAEMEPGFFSDYGYGNGTALTFIDDPEKERKKQRDSKKS